MLARARTSLLVLVRTSVIASARIRVAVAQTTLVIVARRLTPLQCKSIVIYGFDILGSETCRISVVMACLRNSLYSRSIRRGL
jgi:hypothetical protein